MHLSKVIQLQFKDCINSASYALGKMSARIGNFFHIEMPTIRWKIFPTHRYHRVPRASALGFLLHPLLYRYYHTVVLACKTYCFTDRNTFIIVQPLINIRNERKEYKGIEYLQQLYRRNPLITTLLRTVGPLLVVEKDKRMKAISIG